MRISIVSDERFSLFNMLPFFVLTFPAFSSGMKGAQSANVCLEYLCNSHFPPRPQLWLASGINIGQTLTVQLVTSVKAQERIACGKDFPVCQTMPSCSVGSFPPFPLPSGQTLKMKVIACVRQFARRRLGCANGWWRHGGRDPPGPCPWDLLPGPPQRSDASHGRHLFYSFPKGRSRATEMGFFWRLCFGLIYLSLGVCLK